MQKFTRAELVQFGNFLLSKERRDTFRKTRRKGFSLKERLSEVHHADVENFISSKK